MSWDYIPRDTFVHRMHPLTKLMYAFTMMMLIISFDDPLLLFVVWMTSISLYVLAKLPRKTIFGVFKIFIAMTPLYLIFGFLFYGRPPGSLFLFYVVPMYKWFPVTLEGIVWTMGALLKLYVLVSSIRILTFVTPITSFVRAGAKLKMPPFVTIAFSIGLAGVPVATNQYYAIRDAQRARGLKFETRNPKKLIFDVLIPMLLPQIICSMRRSIDMAKALEARGFGYGMRKRTYMREIDMRLSDYLFLATFTIVVLLSIFVGSWGLGYGSYKFTVNLIKSMVR